MWRSSCKNTFVGAVNLKMITCTYPVFRCSFAYAFSFGEVQAYSLRSKNLLSEICRQNPTKASFMYSRRSLS